MKKRKYKNLGKIRSNYPKPEDQGAKLNPTWEFGEDDMEEYDLQEWIII